MGKPLNWIGVILCAALVAPGCVVSDEQEPELAPDAGLGGEPVLSSAFGSGKIEYSTHTVHRSTYHLVKVNLRAPGITIRTTRESERMQTTSAFANSVGAEVAVNGDWFHNGRPRGITRSDGVQWGNDLWDNSWIACTANNLCRFDTAHEHTTADPPENYINAVGGNYSRLIWGGTVRTPDNGEAVYTANTPRTAIGISLDQRTMYLLAVDQGPGGGTRWANIAEWLKGQGAWNAMMFDGGGSTTMVVDGQRKNRIKAGQSRERSVANHFAIMYHEGYFADDDGHWAERDTEAVYNAGITVGCAQGTRPRFCPDEGVSRYHMAVFLVRAFKLPLSSTNYFDDDNGHPHERYANALYRAGITTGVGPRRYGGDQLVTRGQMVTFLSRALKLSKRASPDYFNDDSGTFYEGYANEFASRGWLNGCGSGRLCGEDFVTRAEMAAMLTRSLGLPR